MPKILLAAQTGAGQSAIFEMNAVDQTIPAVFACPGLALAEIGTLQKRDASGSWADVNDGTLQQLTATINVLYVAMPGVYRINKAATAAAVPVEVSYGLNP